MAKRKTFDVKEFKDKTNMRLALATLTQEQKATLCVILEDILHDTGNYQGFCSLVAGQFDSEYSRHYY
jgi:hypothetical protein